MPKQTSLADPALEMSGGLCTSRFTFAFRVTDGVLLYSSNTGAVVRISGSDAGELASYLAGPPRQIRPGLLPEELEADLIESGMLLNPGADELKTIRERYASARKETPMALTITTTMDCNLGCYYCYEERTDDRLEFATIPGILELVASRLQSRGKRSLHVDWYGGEPMLNLEFLSKASRALQKLCRSIGVSYSASIISNGTAWPNDVGRFIRMHRVRQVQISFDGLQANHDKRRRYRRGRAPSADASSFKRAISLVDELLDYVRVDLRFNIDRQNADDLPGFLAMMRKRGWYGRKYPIVFQPARLSAYSDRSAFMKAAQITGDEYDRLRELVRETAGSEVLIEESEAPDGFPFPRTSVCAALANDSVVVGADSQLYRCGLQVGEAGRAVGALQIPAKDSRRLPILESRADTSWWDEFDPTQQPKCSECSFLPICWSGCPKKHLEGDIHAIDEQGAYWRRNLGRLVATGVGAELEAGNELQLSDQFR